MSRLRRIGLGQGDRMSGLLGSIRRGGSQTGIRIVLAAQEKMGKTSLCAGAPDVLLVPLEVGFAGVRCAVAPMINDFESFLNLIQEVTTLAQRREFPFRTIAFDSATALERMIHDYILRTDPAKSKSATMASAHGGYGKAYDLSTQIFDGVLKQLDALAVHGGINIIFTCHVFSSRVSDPTAGEYDSWDLLLHSPKNNKTYGKRETMAQWADVVGFLYEPVFLVTGDKGTMTRATSQNKGRMLALSRTPSYLAGNRFGMMGEHAIPGPPANGWNTFADALYKATGNTIDLYTR